MAQLSRLAKLYLKISEDLLEDDVRNLRSLLSHDGILGKAKVEKATPLEIFNMLVDNDTIGKGNLKLLVQILRCLGKGKLANEAERLEQEHKIEEKKLHGATAKTPESSASPEDAQTTNEKAEIAVTVTGDSASDDSELEDTEVKKIISVETPPGHSTTDYQQTDEAPDDTDVHCVTSELASLHIRELVRLRNEPKKTPGLGPDETHASADNQDVKARLETLLAELDTPAVMADQEKQFHLYCQIGDLYRAKLYNLQSALQYYQSMIECSQSLSEDIKQARAHNRLGLTYDMLGKHEEAMTNHKRVLDICKVAVGDEIDLCVAYKNLASSLTLSGKVSDAKTNYKAALRVAREAKNNLEEVDIHCKLGDLHRQQLKEPHISHKHYTKMLALAKDSGRNFWEMLAYSRLGNVCSDIQDNELALEWHQKALKMSKESADKRDQIIAHMNFGASIGGVNQTSPHLDTALQMAQEDGKQHTYGQMWIYRQMGDMRRNKFNSPYTAIQYYEQYVRLARELGDRREEGWAYNSLGLAYMDIGKYEPALEQFQQHLEIGQQSGDKKEEITALTAVGNALRFLGKIEQAKSHLTTALQMAQQTENQHGQMDVNCKMGDMQREQLHSPRTAIQHYEQYLALARQLMNRAEEALAYDRLGLAHFDMGEYEKALKWHQKHLDMSQDNADSKQQIRAHTNIGSTYRLLGKPDQATSHISTALTIAEQTGDQHGQMEVYIKTGNLHREQLHSPRTAIQYYEKHLAIARQLGDRRQEALAYSCLGHVHYGIEEYVEALEWYHKALKIREDDGDRKTQVTQHTDIGNAYRKLGKEDQATSHFNTALQIAQQTGDLHEQMRVYFCIGDLQKDQLHSPRTAIQYYEQALALARQFGDRREEKSACSRLGQAHFDNGEFETALEWAKKDLDLSREGGCKKEEITAHSNIGKAYIKLSNIGEATSHLKTALEMAEQTGDQHGQLDVYLSLGEMQSEQLHSPRTSIQYYKEALALAMQLEDKHHEGVAYNKMGLAHYEMEEYQLALDWQQKTLKTCEEHGDKKQMIAAHLCVGQTYSKLGKVDEATSQFNTALQMAQQTGDQQGQMRVYREMGDLQRKQLHSQRTAIQYYEQALALARQLGDRREERMAYNRLGLTQHDMREHKAALEWFQKDLKMSQEHGNKEDQITAHACVGNAYMSLGKTDEATSHFNTALQMAQQTGDQHGQMEIYCKMGDLQRKQLHSPGTAIQHYEQYLALARQLGDRRQEHGACSKLGLAHSEMGEYKAALEWHQKALKVIQECGDKTGEITAHTNVGNACKFLGELDQATSHFNTALQMAQQTGDQHGQMDVYFYMGDMNVDQLHSPRESIQYFEQAVALARQLEDVHHQAVGYCRLGEAHHEMREHQVALEWFQKCLAMSQGSGNMKEQITAHKNIANSYKALGKPDQARSHYQSAMAIAMETGNKQEQDAITESLSIL